MEPEFVTYKGTPIHDYNLRSKSKLEAKVNVDDAVKSSDEVKGQLENEVVNEDVDQKLSKLELNDNKCPNEMAGLTVFNIPNKLTEVGLFNCFSQFGKVLSSRFAPRFKGQGHSVNDGMRKFGFVDMGSKTEAVKAINKINEAPPFFMHVTWRIEEGFGVQSKLLAEKKDDCKVDFGEEDWEEKEQDQEQMEVDSQDVNKGQEDDVQAGGHTKQQDEDEDLTEEQMDKLSPKIFGCVHPLVLPDEHFKGKKCSNWCNNQAKIQFINSGKFVCSLKCKN